MAQMMAQMGAMGFDPTNPNQNPFDILMNQQNQQPPKWINFDLLDFIY